MTRREWLIGGTASLAVPAMAAPQPEPLFLWLAASHEGHTLGVLGTATVLKHQTAIEKLRTQNSYYPRFTYVSTNRYKLPFGRNVVRYFLSDPKVFFVARTTPSRHSRRSSLFPPDAAVLVQQIRELLETAVSFAKQKHMNTSSIALDVSSPQRPKRQQILARLQERFPELRYFERASEKQFPKRKLPNGRLIVPPNQVAELAAFLTCSAAAFFDPPKSGPKVALHRYLAGELKVAPVGPPPLEKHRQFRVLIRGAA